MVDLSQCVLDFLTYMPRVCFPNVLAITYVLAWVGFFDSHTLGTFAQCLHYNGYLSMSQISRLKHIWPDVSAVTDVLAQIKFLDSHVSGTFARSPL